MKVYIAEHSGGHDVSYEVLNEEGAQSYAGLGPAGGFREAVESGWSRSEDGDEALIVVEIPDPPEKRWIVVVEWGDGLVGTNGPYVDKDSAATGAIRVAKQIQWDTNANIHQQESGFYRLGEDGEDTIDVYVQEMGKPVRV